MNKQTTSSPELPSKIVQFIKLAGGDHLSFNSSIFFYDLVASFHPKRTIEQEKELVSFIEQNPEILTYKLKKNLVFDYFFDKVTKVSHSIKLYDFWLSSLIRIIDLLKDIDAEDILQNKTYIYRVQSNIHNHTELFDYILNYTDFYVDDPEYLTYSIIARDELNKLKILEKIFNIAEFKGVFDVALRFGRIRIVKYLKYTLKLDINDYGHILEFENYTPNYRYVYYKTGLNQLSTNAAIIGSQQNYVDSIKRILESYEHKVTVATLDIWADLARSKVNKWDKINFKEVVDVFRPYIHSSIPLSHDFKEFNYDVFGKEWSDRKCIIEYCKQLENQLDDLQQKHDYLLNRYNNLIDKDITYSDNEYEF